MKLLKEFLSERLRRLFVANALAHSMGRERNGSGNRAGLAAQSVAR
jgi:hypothetical protein